MAQLQNFLLLDTDLSQLDNVLSDNKIKAQQHFNDKGWVCGDVYSYSEYLDLLRDPEIINENQSLNF